MPSQHNYSLLRDQSETEAKSPHVQHRFMQIWLKYKFATLFVVSNILTFIICLLTSRSLACASSPLSQKSPPISQHWEAVSKTRTSQVIDGIEVVGTKCGNSWQEAKAMGCHFDVMASRWYAPECFDKSVLDDMLAEPHVDWNFTWYADKYHRVVVPSEKVLSGEFDKVYPDNLFHIKHCLHLWRKLHHAVIKGMPVDEEILDYKHTVHCTKMIMDWTSPNFQRHSVTSAKSGTPFCRSNPVGLLEMKG